MVGQAERRLTGAGARLQPRLIEAAVAAGSAGLAGLSDRMRRSLDEAGGGEPTRWRMVQECWRPSIIIGFWDAVLPW